MTERTPVQFKPGVFRQGSEAEMTGNWYETHLIRWTGNVMRPIAGWEKIVLTIDSGGTQVPFPGFASKVRKIHTWVDRAAQIKWTGVLCEEHLYVIDQGGQVRNITPTVPISGPGDDAPGGYGDNIYYGAGGGLNPPNAPPFTTNSILPTPDEPPDTFEELPPLYPDPHGYGKPRPDRPASEIVSLTILGPMWSLDNFGDDLIALASTDGRILQWKPSAPNTPAAEIVTTVTGKPVPRGRCFVVTEQRHIMLFNTIEVDGNHMNRAAWCAQEQIGDWDYSNTTSSAGYYDFEPASPFVTACVSRNGVLAFTATEAYILSYSGVPYIYTYTMLGNYNAPIAGDAIATLPNRTIWQADDGFWQFEGMNVLPLPCPILDWVQRNIDVNWKHRRCVAVPLGVESEVWFFFPGRGEMENTLYAAFNFDEKWWSMGKLGRSAGEAGSVMNPPLMSDGKFIYAHERGLFYTDAPELPYAQTAAINIASGARQSTLRQGIVDTRAPAGDVQFMIGARKGRIQNPSNTEDLQMSLAVQRDRGRLDFRVTGRDAIIRIQSTRNGVEPWTFGQFLVKKIPRGQR